MTALALDFELENSARCHFGILSGEKNLVFSLSYEILRSLRSLRMTSEGTVPTLIFSEQELGTRKKRLEVDQAKWFREGEWL
jgi:hypothetical protein